MKWTLLLAVVSGLTFPEGGAAQNSGDEAAQDSAQYSIGALMIGLDLGVPVGEFRDYVDVSLGLGAGGLFHLNESRSLAVRADLSYVAYGHNKKARNLFFDSHTTNSILSVGVGPQFNRSVGSGRLYAFATTGFSRFLTEKTWSLTAGLKEFRPALTVGGGFSTDLRINGTIGWDFSASYRRHGTTTYRVPGNDTDIESDANVMVFRVGLFIPS